MQRKNPWTVIKTFEKDGFPLKVEVTTVGRNDGRRAFSYRIVGVERHRPFVLYIPKDDQTTASEEEKSSGISQLKGLVDQAHDFIINEMYDDDQKIKDELRIARERRERNAARSKRNAENRARKAQENKERAARRPAKGSK